LKNRVVSIVRHFKECFFESLGAFTGQQDTSQKTAVSLFDRRACFSRLLPKRPNHFLFKISDEQLCHRE